LTIASLLAADSLVVPDLFVLEPDCEPVSLEPPDVVDLPLALVPVREPLLIVRAPAVEPAPTLLPLGFRFQRRTRTHTHTHIHTHTHTHTYIHI
jgi:hypothetical protein